MHSSFWNSRNSGNFHLHGENKTSKSKLGCHLSKQKAFQTTNKRLLFDQAQDLFGGHLVLSLFPRILTIILLLSPFSMECH